MLKRKLITSVVFVVFIGRALPASAQWSITDGAFSSADWSAPIILPESVLENAVNAGTITSGGLPGNYRRVDHDYSSTAATTTAKIFAAHLRNSLTYDPATDGAITNLTYSFDLGEYDDDWPESSKHCMAYSLLIRQNSIFYRGPSERVCETGGDRDGNQPTLWIPIGPTELTATDFVRVSPVGEGTPDFSCKGSPIEFGFRTGNSTGRKQTRQIQTWSGIDNYAVEIESTPCTPPRDPCCPPWNGDTLKNLITPETIGSGSNAPFYLSYGGATAGFHQQMQDYTDYISNFLPTNQTTVTFVAFDYGAIPAGGCTTLTGSGTEIAPRRYLRWTAGSGSPDPDILGPNTTGLKLTGFWSPTGPQSQSLQSGNCYKLHTSISLPNGQSYFPRNCAVNNRWYWRDSQSARMMSAAVGTKRVRSKN